MKTAMVSIPEEEYRKLTENISISRYEYERMRETIELMRDKEALADIVESTEQIKQGKFKTIEQLQKELQLDDDIICNYPGETGEADQKVGQNYTNAGDGKITGVKRKS